MSTATQSVAGLFEKAEAIVEAEWMRLTLDDDIDEGALIQPSAEMTASRPHPPLPDNGGGAHTMNTTGQRLSGRPQPV